MNYYLLLLCIVKLKFQVKVQELDLSNPYREGMLPLDRDESLHGHCERGVDWGREGHVGQGQEGGQDGGQDLAAATL